MRKRRALLAAILLLTVLLNGCGSLTATAGTLPPSALLLEMVAPDANYTVHAGNHPDYPPLTAEEAGILWGSARSGTSDALPEWALLQDYAVAFSRRAQPAEYAVFLCRSSRDTKALATLCLNRAAALRAYWEQAAADPAVSAAALEALDAAAVRICGRYVLFAVHPQADALLRAAQERLG